MISKRAMIWLGLGLIALGWVAMQFAAAIFVLREEPAPLVSWLGSVCFWWWPVPIVCGLGLMLIGRRLPH